MLRVLLCLFVLGCSFPALVRADEQIRQVQEELRKRNLYFGNVDGQSSPELSAALKRYQKRKGFAVTGNVDQVTATSLHIVTEAVPGPGLPDLPILKSDTASALPESQRLALEREAEENPDSTPSPPAPAESVPPNQDITPDRVNKFVSDYLRDAEGQDVAAQVKYYAFPVRYFDHGSVSESFVTKDTSDYIKRWPERKYTLLGPVAFFAASEEGETSIEFNIAFELHSGARTSKNKAIGRTQNWWTVRAEGNDLKIVAIREQRLRE